MASTILVVEDSPVIGALMKKVVERNTPGITLLNATDGKDGVEMLRQYRPDLVVLDWMMPDFGGRYFLEEQRKDPEVADTPVILHSAVPQNAIQNEFEGFASIVEFIPKPVVPTKLYERIQAHLGGDV